LTWAEGQTTFEGLRNEVAINYDKHGNLFGVENGVDNLNRRDLGGNIHEDNPSEEVNFLGKNGFYGYPYCWSEGKLPAQYAKGPGTQWVHEDFMGKGNYSDAWCRDHSIRPVFNLEAHTAPLDIVFYYGTSFPQKYQNNAFIAQHGSWNRNTPIGYKVTLMTMDPNTHMPVSAEPFLYHQASARWPRGFRPVGLAVKKCSSGDCLYVSSDATREIIEISYLK